jgi:hypothetical protein
MEPTTTTPSSWKETAKYSGLVLFHIAMYMSAFLLLLIPFAQEPESTSCVILRTSGLVLNFIRPGIFYSILKYDKVYVMIEFIFFNVSFFSLPLTYSKLPLLSIQVRTNNSSV